MTETTQVTREHVLETIREQLTAFEVKPEDVSPEVSYDSLGLDSLDLVELSVRIEDVYGVDIEEDDLKDVWKIDDAIDIVMKKLEAA